ncbi:unnamed protein product [Somion occarium]|uniref:Uncharacterized protein n=1 Tax=Somion occarium TaxID=3059160 RepID=A0ABP1CTD7_9APHY
MDKDPGTSLATSAMCADMRSPSLTKVTFDRPSFALDEQISTAHARSIPGPEKLNTSDLMGTPLTNLFSHVPALENLHVNQKVRFRRMPFLPRANRAYRHSGISGNAADMFALARMPHTWQIQFFSNGGRHRLDSTGVLSTFEHNFFVHARDEATVNKRNYDEATDLDIPSPDKPCLQLASLDDPFRANLSN